MGGYLTVRREASAEFTERRSRFIGCAKPVETEKDALSFLNTIRSKHWDASHNVYAYALRSGQLRRYSDDGEPQGTAGIPVLDVLVKSGLVDTAVVVTRYFGGVLLGAGGLVRAYSHAASLAVRQAGVAKMRPCRMMRLFCSYSQYGLISALIPQCGGTVDETGFTDTVEMKFHMAKEDCPAFEKKLADATAGSVSFDVTGEKYFEFLEDI
ncbi:YigZ family protein [Ruminococcaceae bacterium BL-6]|nr:YigZ family protein [Ruminococcaceae bacterium BL-6]